MITVTTDGPSFLFFLNVDNLLRLIWVTSNEAERCFFYTPGLVMKGGRAGIRERMTEAKRKTSGDRESKSLAATLGFGFVTCYLCGLSSLPACVSAGTYTYLCVRIEKYVCVCV